MVLRVRTSLSPLDQLALLAWMTLLAGICLMSGLLGAPILPAVVAAVACLIVLTVFRPAKMLPFVVAMSILVPVDVAASVFGLPRIGPTRTIIALFLLGLLIRSAFLRETMLDLKNLPLKIPIAIFLLFSTVSATLSVAPKVSWFAIVGRVLLEQFVFFAIFYVAFGSRLGWHSIKKALYVSTVLVCAFGLFERVTEWNPLLAFFPPAYEYPEFREGIMRLRSTFFHPIALGCFLNFVYPFLLIDLFCERPFARKFFIGLLLVSTVLLLLSTVSRMPLLVALLETALLFFWWARKTVQRQLATLMLLTFGLGAVAIAYQSETIVYRLISPALPGGRVDEGSSEYYRVVLWKAVLNKIEGLRWLYGYGPNAFYLAEVEFNYDGFDRVLEAPDSNYIRLLLESGILGLASFLALILAAMARIVRAGLAVGSSLQPLALACLGAVAGFALNNVTASEFEMYPLGTLFWMLTALAIRLPGWRTLPGADALAHVPLQTRPSS